jgi:hypothetical protein
MLELYSLLFLEPKIMLYESKNIVYMLMVLTKLSERCKVLYFLLYFTQNEKRERIVKASRDVTTSSKKVIFQIHRINRANRGAALQQAERDLHAVQSIHVRRVAQELKANETWKYKRAFSPGVGFFE